MNATLTLVDLAGTIALLLLGHVHGANRHPARLRAEFAPRAWPRTGRSRSPIAAKRLKRGLAFSAEGQAEIRAMLERLASNVNAAAAVFMTDDPRAARRQLAEEEVFRDLEAHATETHFARIRAGRVESVETSALHLDVLRDLKPINGHLTAAADTVLDRIGELLPSRLRRDAPVGEES